jgi:hypothetical protein
MALEAATMERQQYDRSSKWLIEHHGDSILFLGHVRDIAEWRTRQAELVQPRKLPDGLLDVRRQSENRFHPYLVEIESYAERGTPQDLLDEVMLVYQDRRELPDVLVLVLRPKGQVEVADHLALQSHGGLTSLQANWRVVHLWDVPASELLATGEPGLMPWVPLARLEGPPAAVLGECRRIIDEKAKPEERRNLLAVTLVLMDLVKHDQALYAIFGGKEAMIESPLLQEVISEQVTEKLAQILAGKEAMIESPLLQEVISKQVTQKLAQILAGKEPMIESPLLQEVISEQVTQKLAQILAGKEAMIESPLLQEVVSEQVAEKLGQRVAEEMQKTVLDLLEARFGPVPFDVAQRVKQIMDAPSLRQITKRTGTSPDLDTFRRALESDAGQGSASK